MKVILYSRDSDVKEIVKQASGSWELEILEEEAEFFKNFLSSSPELVILDADISGEIPTQLIEKIRSFPKGKMVPILIFSSRPDRLSLLSSLRYGALDYILKPFDPGEFILKTQSLFRFLELMKRREKDLQELILIDPTTGCYHKNYLSPRLIEELSRAKRYEHHFGIVIFQVDGWKNLEHTYGFTDLEELKVALASSLREMIRRSDALICSDDGVFLMIATETNTSGCQHLIERIHARISQALWKAGTAILPLSFRVRFLNTDQIGYPDAQELIEKTFALIEGGSI